jgi:hypothetical protein
MVASQFSPGSGARWFWEIETNGASAKRCTVNGKSGKSSRPCNVGMDDVELAGLFGDGLEQRGTDGSRIRTRAAQAQGPQTNWDEFGSGAGVPAREQRDVMA